MFETLLTFRILPILNGTNAWFIVFVSLGLSTSNTVVPGNVTSNPLTYALPGDNLTHIVSSDGSLPSSVFWSSVYKPFELISSFKEFWILTLNGFTA